MRIQTPRESRREIVGRISEHLGIPARYEGAPGFAYTIGEIGIWAFKVILGMFAVSWYHDSSKAQIEEIYMACPEGDGRTELLVQRGGTNLLAALLYFGIMCLLQVAILYMAGPSAIQYLMTMAGA